MIRALARFLSAALAAVTIVSGCGGRSAAAPAGGQSKASGLAVPAGFVVDIYARNLSGPRFMAVAPNGDLLVSLTGIGEVVALRGANASPMTVATGLNFPHGLAFDGSTLYIATWDGVEKLAYPGGEAQAVVSGFPENGDHNRRAIAVSPDHTLFVSIGSSCNVCDDQQPLATIQHVSGGSASTYATGLRNASGLAFDPSGRLWAVVNQRDNIGPTQQITDDLPPDELDQVSRGDYGWPSCYPDPIKAKRDPNPEHPNADCSGTVAAALDFQAHSAPLGIVFSSASQFPAAYRGGAFVAFHGSWNRSVPIGDKVVYVAFAGGRPTGYKDFMTGWLRDGRYSGRPAGLAIDAAGDLFVSDDTAGLIYRIRYAP